MPRNSQLASIFVSDKAKKSIQQGHPWIYEQEIISIEGTYENGDILDVYSLSHKYLGSGFISESSKIRIRLLSRNANDVFDEAFFKRRLQHALDYRKSVMGDDFSNCRLIFGEADFFPGLTIDRFGSILVIQTLSFGIEKIKKMLFETLVQLLREDGQQIDGIYERNDVAIRELEGLPLYKGWFESDLFESHPDTITTIIENGISYEVDVENGQKTGYFLDQKYNRLAVSKLAKDKTVLDCFTHTGSFGLNAAKGGAKRVVSVDISQTAIDQAKANAKRNGLDVEFLCVDVFDLLDQYCKQRNHDFDFIILDPPAFTKSRDTIKNATKGYLDINYKAMKLLPRGGYLATCSCSHFMNEGLFKSMLHDAAEKADVSLRQIAVYHQCMDHPILWNVPETNYLKFFIFQVV